MRLTNTPTSYGLIMRMLHWAIAVLILFLVGLGFWVVDLGYLHPRYNAALDLHKALGMVVLVLAVLKLVSRAVMVKVQFQATLSSWERIAAISVHHLLYVAMIAIPITGYTVSTSAGQGIAMFGLFEVPALGRVPRSARDVAIEVHYWLG